MIAAVIVALSRAAGAGLLTMAPLALIAAVGVWAWALRRRTR